MLQRMPAASSPTAADAGQDTPQRASPPAASPCDLCGGRDAAELAASDRSGQPLRTVICRNCGLVYTDPIPSEETLKKFYAQDYRMRYKGSFAPSLKHVYRAGRVAAQRIEDLRELLQPDSVIIDVGSGGGEFVYLLRLSGFDARGVQPDDGYARYSRDELGISVHLGSALDVELAPECCHVVTLYHSLEHLGSPSRVLARVRRWLRPGGRLLVEVPNVEAVCQFPSRRFHQAHLYNFNSACLRELGRKTGFALQRISLSSDGGNITAVFRKDAHPIDATRGIPGNCERIMRVIETHSLLRHFASRHPYRRPLTKLLRMVEERRAARMFSGGKEVLARISRQAQLRG